ncbi:MAG: serine hydrolase [Cyclobacteriaceae bacterium]
MIPSIRIVICLLFILSIHETYAQKLDSLATAVDSVVVDSLSISQFEIEAIVEDDDGSFPIEIDSIVSNAIRLEAFPGCVIYISQGDSTLLFKSYGYHTYDSLRRVAVNDIYDLASVTKVTGATLALMKLYEEGLINLDDPIGKYLDGLGRIRDATIRECLAHQAGLRPWIPYYQEVKKKNGRFRRNTVGPMSESYNYALTDSLFLHKDFYRKIKKMIGRTKISDEKVYRYSGLFFYLVPELVEKLTGTTYDQYLRSTYYDSLGARTLTFNPLDTYTKSQIVPTENDTYFRMEQIHGTVHDEGAITMKGISGNAGLFSNAEDLAKVWRMLLEEGKMDSMQFLRPETIQLFTTTQYPNNGNRRGLGFDKPLIDYDSVASSVAKDASYRSYGHSGYTGTLVWADPENDLLFIFLSNRVYPTRENRNLYKLNVRPSIHQLIYDQIKKGPTK